LGGDSMLEMQFRDQVRERFGATLHEGVLLDYATVNKLVPLVMDSVTARAKRK